MPPRTRWSDERLDDMAATLEKHDRRLDGNSTLLAAVDLKVTEIERDRRLDSDRNFSVKLMLAGVIVAQVIQAIVYATHG